MITHATTDPGSTVTAFSEAVFRQLPRSDQRRWAGSFLRSLLQTPGKKSIRRLAATLSDSPTASHSLHQFLNSSPWDWNPVRAELAHWAARRLRPEAWVIDSAVMPKRGTHSCGVHRRFVDSAGRAITCQVGFGAFLAAEAEALPVHWELLLTDDWRGDAERRRRTRIPGDIPAHIQPGEHVVTLVDSLTRTTGGSARLPVIVAPLPGQSPRPVTRALTRRGVPFLVAVSDPGHLHGSERSAAADRDPLARERARCPRADVAIVDCADGSRVTARSFPVSPPRLHVGRGHHLLTTRLHGTTGSPHHWLTNLGHLPVDKLVELTRLTQRTKDSLGRLGTDFGLLDFEGRSFPGWHHHTTLVSAAYAYSRLAGSRPPELALVT
ncbi:transposase [Streptomyces sp. G44]|uniref:IS701 family transposase n=1 Tax=Streptomyces sp. G44 TaxID=2807632 RepID=UPI0019602ED6|nr:transposase [Streptomyces sp. G44]MBM7167692.1 transposase [Streptomyces sp. G44]